jgi:hypothetical protein
MTPTQPPTFTLQGSSAEGWFKMGGSQDLPPSGFDFTTGILPSQITFTRSSIGTYNSSGNLLVTAGNDVARFNYVSGVSNLLIEPSVTNLVPQSNNFGDSSTWFGGGATLTTTAAQFISPDGTNNGWSVNLSVVGGYMYDGAVGFSNVPYTLSLWVKQITAGISLQLIIAGIASGSIVITTTLVRRSFTATPAAGGATYLIQVPNMAGSIGAYGVQLEAGSVPSSYIPTTTAAVTRAADSATFTIPAGVNALAHLRRQLHAGGQRDAGELHDPHQSQQGEHQEHRIDLRLRLTGGACRQA